MTLATKTSDPYVPGHRWIASLSNGQTIFQDNTPGIESAWNRLRNYVQANRLQITNLRLQAYGQHVQLLPFKADDGSPQVAGYWFSNRMARIFGLSGFESETKEIGIGYLKDGKIHITWVREDGIISVEERLYKPNELGIIVNHVPEIEFNYELFKTLENLPGKTPDIPYEGDEDL